MRETIRKACNSIILGCARVWDIIDDAAQRSVKYWVPFGVAIICAWIVAYLVGLVPVLPFCIFGVLFAAAAYLYTAMTSAIFENEFANMEELVSCKLGIYPRELAYLEHHLDNFLWGAFGKSRLDVYEQIEHAPGEAHTKLLDAISALSLERDSTSIDFRTMYKYGMDIATAASGEDEAAATYDARAMHDEAKKVLRDLLSIWDAALASEGIDKVSVKDFGVASMRRLGEKFGVDMMLDSYYRGVPVEDIVA